MTELSLPDESAAAQPSPDWPPGSHADVTDHLVQQSLAPLSGLPKTPVSEHEAVYNFLHDQLRDALDTDSAGTNSAGTNSAGTDSSSAGRRNAGPADGAG